MKKPASLAKSGFSFLVRLAGIEPTTPWFVAKYSIQLSYSRQASDSMLETGDSLSAHDFFFEQCNGQTQRAR